VIEVASRKDAIILEKKLKNLSGKRLIDFITRHSKKE
jgi:predicted GIY-YIG superfamily endonuclease